MPSGVFQPYAGVSTAILVFTKTNAGGTDHVWFYDMKADGYSLDQKRQPVKENDIPDIIQKFNAIDWSNLNSLPTGEGRGGASFFVPVQEIRDNDYTLSINKYKEIEREVVEYEAPEVILGRLEEAEAHITTAFDALRKMLEE